MKKIDPERAATFENVKIMLPTKTFDKVLQLRDADLKVEMIHVGGQTADSCIVYLSDSSIVFSGHLISSRIYPYGGDPTADSDL